MLFRSDNTEELIECCGCKLTPNGLRTFSINSDLTANPSNGMLPTTGVIKVISATENPNPAHPAFGKCDPTGNPAGCLLPTKCDLTGGLSFTNQAGSIVPTPDVRAWATHIQNRGPSGSYPATAAEFQDSTLASWELAYDQQQCFLLRQLGSGRGACKCGTGD